MTSRPRWRFSTREPPGVAATALHRTSDGMTPITEACCPQGEDDTVINPTLQDRLTLTAGTLLGERSASILDRVRILPRPQYVQ